jgi:hypothetical protein
LLVLLFLFSAREFHSPLPRNGGPDIADDGSSVEPKPVRCY